MSVAIAGAGIGGLTTALSLHAAGIDVTVAEAVTELRPLGVGINLQPHAVRELTELGLGDAVAEAAVPPRSLMLADRHGNEILRMPRGTAAGYRWPQYSIHRGRLQALLLETVIERLGPRAVRTGLAVRDFSDDGDGVLVRLRDRRTGDDVDIVADALVGADGLNSAVRARLHPDEGRPLWSGIRMWRGVTETKPYLDGRTMIVAGSNAAVKLVAYPVADDLVNWVVEAKVAEGRAAAEADWTRTGRQQYALSHVGDWAWPWLDVPGLIAGAEEILEYPMVDRDPLPSWGSGRVTLVGDAAHPMYPIGSNGGSEAVVDARVLAYCLASSGDPVAALADYEARRRESTNAMVLSTREIPADRLLQAVAERAPDGFRDIRDVFRGDEHASLLAGVRAGAQRTTDRDVERLNSAPSWSP